MSSAEPYLTYIATHKIFLDRLPALDNPKKQKIALQERKDEIEFQKNSYNSNAHWEHSVDPVERYYFKKNRDFDNGPRMSYEKMIANRWTKNSHEVFQRFEKWLMRADVQKVFVQKEAKDYIDIAALADRLYQIYIVDIHGQKFPKSRARLTRVHSALKTMVHGVGATTGVTTRAMRKNAETHENTVKTGKLTKEQLVKQMTIPQLKEVCKQLKIESLAYKGKMVEAIIPKLAKIKKDALLAIDNAKWDAA